MKPRQWRHLTQVCLLSSLLAIGVVGGAATGSPVTAKALLAEARQAAARWQPDAVLVSLSALQANDDGTAPPNLLGWTYTFHSKLAGKWVAFHAGQKGLERTELPSGFTQPVPPDFVDSDRVLAEVRRNGFSKDGDTLVTLLLQADPNLRTGVYWCVAGQKEVSVERGVRGFCVDPATGKFVAKLAGKPAAPIKQAPVAAGGALLKVDFARCGGFTAAEAAAILGVPAGRVSFTGKETGPGRGMCSFSGPLDAAIIFDVSVWKSVAEAETEMERERKRLNDDFRDIVGLADDGIWTEVDGSYTGRKANVTIHVTRPSDKIMKLKVAKAFFEHL